MAKKKNTIPKLPKNLSHVNIICCNSEDGQTLILYNDRVDASCIIPQYFRNLPSALFTALPKKAFEEIFEYYDYKEQPQIVNIPELENIVKPEHLSIAYKPMFTSFDDPAAYWCSLYNNTKLTEEEALALADGKNYSPYIISMYKPTFDVLFRNKQVVRC